VRTGKGKKKTGIGWPSMPRPEDDLVVSLPAGPNWKFFGTLLQCRTMQGVVKVYDPNTGSGVVVLDHDRSEVYLRAGSLAGSVFRLLRQGQRIIFDLEESDGLRFVHSVRMGSDGR